MACAKGDPNKHGNVHARKSGVKSLEGLTTENVICKQQVTDGRMLSQNLKIRDLIPEGGLSDAEMMIRVLPDMDVWSRHSPDHIRLQRLDWSNIRVIAAVLGQSVALDFYARSVASY